MASLTDHDGLEIVTPDPTGDGDLALNSNFKKLAMHKAAADPTVNDDENDGYGVGSRWFNTTTKNFFICSDPTATAAVWEVLPVHNAANGTGLQADTGGNARGAYAVDLQRNRTADTQVASGSNAVVGGGRENTGTGPDSTVAGGQGNMASGWYATAGGGRSNTAGPYFYATVAGGRSNTATGQQSMIGGGYSNDASGTCSMIGGGYSNDASGTYSTVGGGYDNTASSYAATVGGGYNNTASTNSGVTVAGGYYNTSTGYNSTVGGGYDNDSTDYYTVVSGGRENVASEFGAMIPGGYQAKADLVCQLAHAGGQFASVGDAQTSVLVARNQTTNATPTELFLNGSTSRLTLVDQDCWLFSIYIVARRTDADNEGAAYKVEGAIDRNGTTTALIGSITKTVIAEDTAAWDVDVQADDTNESLKILVTGESSKTIRWVARIELTEVNG